MQVLFYNESDEKIYDQQGVWSFSWILDGRAIQDVLTYPNLESGFKNTPGDRRIGTTLRYYNPKLDPWRVIWLGVVTGDLGVMTAKGVGDEIWIEEKDESDQSLTRWMFTDITRDSFHWKGLTSYDQGKSWKMGQETFAVRHHSEREEPSHRANGHKPVACILKLGFGNYVNDMVGPVYIGL